MQNLQWHLKIRFNLEVYISERDLIRYIQNESGAVHYYV